MKPDNGQKGRTHVAYMKIHSCVRRNLTVCLLNTIILLLELTKPVYLHLSIKTY